MDERCRFCSEYHDLDLREMLRYKCRRDAGLGGGAA